MDQHRETILKVVINKIKNKKLKRYRNQMKRLNHFDELRGWKKILAKVKKSPVINNQEQRD